jgi:hypothetical protein
MFSVYGPNDKRNTSRKGGGRRFNDQSVDCAIVLDCEKTLAFLNQQSADLFISGSKPVISVGAAIPRFVIRDVRCCSPISVPVGSCVSASGAIAHSKTDSKPGETGRFESVAELFSSDRTFVFWHAELAACKIVSFENPTQFAIRPFACQVLFWICPICCGFNVRPILAWRVFLPDWR